eukprot:12242-Pyramimonas_sp.AAC.2
MWIGSAYLARLAGGRDVARDKGAGPLPPPPGRGGGGGGGHQAPRGRPRGPDGGPHRPDGGPHPPDGVAHTCGQHLKTDQSDAGSARIFSRWTNQTQEYEEYEEYSSHPRTGRCIRTGRRYPRAAARRRWTAPRAPANRRRGGSIYPA